MPDTNDRLTKLEEARAIIEDNLVVMAHMEKRQSEMLKEHAIFIHEMRESIEETRKSLQAQAERGRETDIRIEKLVSATGNLISKQ